MTDHSTPTFRGRLAVLAEDSRFQRAIIVLIVVNAIALGLETSPAIMSAAGPALVALDHVVLAIFVAELAIRIGACGWSFFRDPWSIFDFVVVALALAPSTENFSVLRALRVLRVLRLITAVPQMRRVVGGLLSALPGLGSVAALLALLFYVAAVMATQLFGDDFPQWFGTLWNSLYSLFQIMTLESWSMGIVRPVMEVQPYACLSIPSFNYQMTPKISLNVCCSISISKNLSINGRTRSSGQLGIWSYNINPCRNNECVRYFTVFAFNHRS